MRTLKTIIFLVILGNIIIQSNCTAQISPGDLTEVHKHLEGLSNCTQCHTLGDKVTDEKCLDCHKEIKTLIDQNRGYHASSEVKAKNCFECHNDHHGRNFQIIRFDPDKFDHNLSGYELTGAHAKKECKDCHKPDFISSQKFKEKATTYLGLETACLTCHEDYHQGTLNSNCLDCHNFEKYKPAPKFDHNNAKFQLRGKHKNLDCIKCHIIGEKEGKTYQEFKGIEFANCTNCHEDIHKNKFGQNCTKCHSEESFHIIKDMDVFDHERTAFPLEGKHIAVDCKKCHQSSYTDPLPHQKCLDCHKDYHEGQFIKNEVNTDCKVCHSVDGFKGSSFTIDNHAELRFKLEGAHMATPCFDCHLKNDKWVFRELGINCVECHEDIHNTFINKKYYPESDCRKCHDVSRWSQVSFEHSITDFKLEGKHASQTCRACHFPVKEGKTTQLFSQLNSECIQCHNDIHYSQFENGGKTDCLRCHAFADWNADKFDHNKARFTLDGKHKDVACNKCHIEITEDNKVYTKYKMESFKCEDCH